MTKRILFLAAAAFAVPAGAASAAEVAALVGDGTIAILDTDAGRVSATMPVTGVAGAIAGIDVRPATGVLHALGTDGAVYTVDLASGAATRISTLSTMLADGVAATVDFNPVADRLRVIGSDGTNLRANVEDGKVTEDGRLAYAEGDAHAGTAPRVVAGAYTNAYAGTEETVLYDIDEATGALLRQAPPNDGILNTIAVLAPAAEITAFDIESDGAGGNRAWVVVGSALHGLDLATGAVGDAMAIDGLEAPVRDIAVLPAR
ncbi:MAG: DUF4394 domain-containing protein [Rhizobiales bacterium]|nr:DUF4394 domain-containing protein [Hyphomicrobiales bacterium]